MNNLMLRITLLFVAFSLTKAGAQNNKFYDLKFKTINNSLISASTFSGKKVLIATFDASNLNKIQLKSLDTLQQNNKNNLIVIAIPVSDFGTPVAESQIKKLLIDTLLVSYLVTPIAKAQKGNGKSQQALMSFLTDKNQNTNFDMDVESAEEQFIINEKGFLFASFKSPIPVNSNIMHHFLAKQIK